MGKFGFFNQFNLLGKYFSKETLVLDYPLQQEKLVPCLASTHAFFLTFMKLENFRKNILDNEIILFELLPEVMIENIFTFLH